MAAPNMLIHRQMSLLISVQHVGGGGAKREVGGGEGGGGGKE